MYRFAFDPRAQRVRSPDPFGMMFSVRLLRLRRTYTESSCLTGLLTNLRFERQKITISPELSVSPTADGGSCSSTVYGRRHVSIDIRQSPVNFIHSPEHDSASLSKKELIELVEQQFDLWPHESFKWAPKRDTTVKVLRHVLLSPDFGFGRVGKSS
jgi:hypothetical protein